MSASEKPPRKTAPSTPPNPAVRAAMVLQELAKGGTEIVRTTSSEVAPTPRVKRTREDGDDSAAKLSAVPSSTPVAAVAAAAFAQPQGSKEIAALRAGLRFLRESEAKLAGENAKLQARNAFLQQQLVDLERQHGELRGQVSQFRFKIQESENKITELTGELSQAHRDLEYTRGEADFHLHKAERAMMVIEGLAFYLHPDLVSSSLQNAGFCQDHQCFH